VKGQTNFLIVVVVEPVFLWQFRRMHLEGAHHSNCFLSAAEEHAALLQLFGPVVLKRSHPGGWSLIVVVVEPVFLWQFRRMHLEGAHHSNCFLSAAQEHAALLQLFGPILIEKYGSFLMHYFGYLSSAFECPCETTCAL